MTNGSAARPARGSGVRLDGGTSEPAGEGTAESAWHGTLRGLPFFVLFVLAAALPFVADEYWSVIAARAAIYWVLVSGLNLVVGFAGQLAIGYVGLLAVGAYAASVLCTSIGALPALAAAGGLGAASGVLVGLPALRLRTFYFAMTTLGFATIVTQVALAWTSVTGGGIGLPGPALPGLLATSHGFTLFCIGLAALSTWLCCNIAASRFGRSLIALRDTEVAAEAMGLSKPNLLLCVFLFSGAAAGIAGALFASLQSYITPDAFTFDLSVLFFIAILVGGRGSVLGPLLGTILLTVLPEFAAPLVAWSTFLYAVLLLAIVLLVPGGIAELIDFKNRRALASDRAIQPLPALLEAMFDHTEAPARLTLSGIVLSFGGVRAIDGLDVDIAPGTVHGLIGPNGSGKTTTLNVISGFSAPQAGTVAIGTQPLAAGRPASRARRKIARTFQTPRIIGEASVLDNAMVGGAVGLHAGFVEAALALPRSRREEAALRREAMLALRIVGLDGLAAVRADRLQHSELRFLEIARALLLHPAFLLLDEPAAGLSAEEIRRLGALIREISRRGTGVLLVEHHADLIFDICDRVTVLNLGRILAAGTPAEIRAHQEVVSVYLGG